MPALPHFEVKPTTKLSGQAFFERLDAEIIRLAFTDGERTHIDPIELRGGL